MLDLTAEFSEAPGFLELNYCNIPVLDLTGMNASQLREASEYIARNVDEGVVYVHCKIGYSRSAAAVGAYLLATGQVATATQCVAVLRSARPSIVIRAEVFVALEAFQSEPPMPLALWA